MYFNGRYYTISNDQDFIIMKKNIKQKRSELSKLESKFFKNKVIRNEISLISQDIEGALFACEEYETEKEKHNTEKSITVFSNEFKVSGISYRKDAVGEVINTIKDEYNPEFFCGYSNKEIEEYGDATFKYEDFYTHNFKFEHEPSNIHDENAIKIFINNIHVGYVPKSINNTLNDHIDKKNIKIIGTAWIIGGPYKKFDYYEDKVINRKLDFGIEIKLRILDYDLL